MDMSRILIAKTGKTASEWLPLAVHLEDTAGIMQCMIRDMIPPSFPESCALSPEAFEKTAVFLAYVHDIGKAMLVFQYKISRNLPEMRSRLEHFQLQFPESYEKDKINVIPHAQAGEEILVTLGCPESVAAVAGAHHGMPSEHIQKNLMQPRRNIKFYENYYGYAEGNVSLLTETWNHILQRALQIARIDSVQELPVLTKPAQMLLSGLLIMADWIASNTDYFPLIPTDEDIPENPERIADAWETIQFPEMWKSARLDYSDAAFRKNFSFAPRLVQTEFLNVIKNIESPGICILEAPMGCGKTGGCPCRNRNPRCEMPEKRYVFRAADTGNCERHFSPHDAVGRKAVPEFLPFHSAETWQFRFEYLFSENSERDTGTGNGQRTDRAQLVLR